MAKASLMKFKCFSFSPGVMTSPAIFPSASASVSVLGLGGSGEVVHDIVVDRESFEQSEEFARGGLRDEMEG
jgi:hypothetical protein